MTIFETIIRHRLLKLICPLKGRKSLFTGQEQSLVRTYSEGTKALASWLTWSFDGKGL